MKNFKIIILLVATMTVTFYSCSDNKSIENEAVTKKSISLRTYLGEIKKSENIAGRDAVSEDDFCFSFVYPISLSYNNGTVVTVTSFNGLLSLLENETPNLFIEGIAFPFQVETNGTVVTISSEAEFVTLINGCDYNTVDEDIYLFDCFDIVYPYSVINQNNQVIVINSENELFNLFATPTSNNYIIDFVYPISITNGTAVTVQVNNIYELYQLLDQCDSTNSDCVCEEIYQPVCVNDPVNFITLTFPNACFAECAGYTPADFVNCGIVSPINFGSQLGTCFNVSYPVQVQYQGALVTANNNGQLLQYYFPATSTIPAFVYPVTVTFLNGTPTGNTVTITSQAGFEAAINNNCN